MNPLLKLSLRGHKSSVSCIARVQDDLVSADRDGWVVLWNLTTKRPRALWKAHQGQILTLKYTAMGLLTHGRDSELRLWNLSESSLRGCSSDVSVVGNEEEPKKPQYEELPVNALNFCNVDFWELPSEGLKKNALVVTPASVDSDNFDVYKISSDGSTFAIQRVIENFAIRFAQSIKLDLEEINDPDLILKQRGHGIVMRLRFISENLLFVGYESGALFGLDIRPLVRDLVKKADRLVINTGYKVTLKCALKGHTPLPILSLEYDNDSKVILCGSASKKILRVDLSPLLASSNDVIESHKSADSNITSKEDHANSRENSGAVPHPILNKWGLKQPTTQKPATRSTSDFTGLEAPGFEESNSNAATTNELESQVSLTNLKHYGIQCVQFVTGGYAVAFWDGTIKVINNDQETISTWERAEEALQALNVVDNPSGPTKKSICIFSWRAKSSDERQIVPVQTRIRTRETLADKLLLFVGHGDGLIRAYFLSETIC